MTFFPWRRRVTLIRIGLFGNGSRCQYKAYLPFSVDYFCALYLWAKAAKLLPDKASLTCNIGACISSGVRIHLSKMQSIFFVPHRHQSKSIDRQKRGLPQNVGQTSENTGARLQDKDENTVCSADDRRRYADLSCCIKETSPCKAADARRRLSASHH